MLNMDMDNVYKRLEGRDGWKASMDAKPACCQVDTWVLVASYM